MDLAPHDDRSDDEENREGKLDDHQDSGQGIFPPDSQLSSEDFHWLEPGHDQSRVTSGGETHDDKQGQQDEKICGLEYFF